MSLFLQLIDKLSVKTPTGEAKLKVMKEIAKDHNIEWDTSESEKELLKPPEELIEGPRKFVSATSVPVKPATNHCPEPKESMTRKLCSRSVFNQKFSPSTVSNLFIFFVLTKNNVAEEKRAIIVLKTRLQLLKQQKNLQKKQLLLHKLLHIWPTERVIYLVKHLVV